jgi:hypothetical protein
VADGPPLAHHWLEQQFEDPAARSQFVNSTVNLSKAILGRAYILEELKERRNTISHCACRRALDGLIEGERASLLVAQRSLGSSLAPLLDTSPHSASRTITAQAARRLDAAVLKLVFAATPDDATQLDESKNVLRQLL